MAAFDPCVAFTLAAEAGFADTPGDRGGPTNMGITQHTLSQWLGRPASYADVRTLAHPIAVAIYRVMYWEQVSGDDLPPGLDLLVFDFAVNAGPQTSARLLQHMLCVAQDGDIGPETLRRAACALPVLRSRITALDALHQAHYHVLPGFAEFGRGWLARSDRARAAALAMTITPPPLIAKAAPPVAPSALPELRRFVDATDPALPRVKKA